MQGYDEMAELAPRDTVTRAILSEMVSTNAKHVYLDLTHLDKNFVKKRFPQIYSTCLQYNIDITEEMIPVCPAAHYIMGGVRTNIDGETSIKGLFAAGEVACTGVHGANRLASNSLLEGLVFGALAGKKAANYINEGLEDSNVLDSAPEEIAEKEKSAPESFDAEKIRSSLRQIMWDNVGIIRCQKSLGPARDWLKRWNVIMDTSYETRREAELGNMLTVAQLITSSALLREGSVGAHYRSDFKEKGKHWEKHTASEKGKAPFWID
jgi:L-aspartate oxidase